MAAVALPAAMPAAAAGKAVLAGSPAIAGILSSVTAISARQAWAVGYTTADRTLIARWNGKIWKQVPSPVRDGVLLGTAAASAGDAWAVGRTSSNKTLILHWTRKAWKRTPSPTLIQDGDGVLIGAAVSGRSGWAVGCNNCNQAGETPIVLQLDGGRWFSTPVPGGADNAFLLAGVTALSARYAWAVGYTYSGHALILRWNGNLWSRVPIPVLGPGESWLYGVTATAADNAWAVGCTACASQPKTLILHWNGLRWSRVHSPNPRVTGGSLYGVAATSAHSAWAVGQTGGLFNLRTHPGTLILRWNGTKWTRVPSPNPRLTGGILNGVAATGPANAWAVGQTGHPFDTANPKALELRWNGRAWNRASAARP